MSDVANDLRSTLASEHDRLIAMSDEEASLRPAPGKWSPKEVIGHLVDSASNNHGRFVRAQLEEDLIFPGYEQDAWVAAQNYNSRSWRELLDTWMALNTHIAAVIGEMSPGSLSRLRGRHNLDQIAWHAVPREQPVTLDYFVRDYVGHMKHHLAQIR